MNKKQKEFLKELKTLCDKYHIDTIFSQNNYIGIVSNSELMLIRTYADGKFSGIATSVNDYEVEE